MAFTRLPADAQQANPICDGAPLLHARLRGEPGTALDSVAVGTLVLRDILGLDAEAVATTDRIAYRQSAEAAAASALWR